MADVNIQNWGTEKSTLNDNDIIIGSQNNNDDFRITIDNLKTHITAGLSNGGGDVTQSEFDALESQVNTNTAGLTGKADISTTNDLNTRVTDNTNQINAQTTTITQNTTNITNKADQDDLDTTNTNVTNLTSRVTANETNISNIVIPTTETLLDYKVPSGNNEVISEDIATSLGSNFVLNRLLLEADDNKQLIFNVFIADGPATNNGSWATSINIPAKFWRTANDIPTSTNFNSITIDQLAISMWAALTASSWRRLVLVKMTSTQIGGLNLAGGNGYVRAMNVRLIG